MMAGLIADPGKTGYLSDRRIMSWLLHTPILRLKCRPSFSDEEIGQDEKLHGYIYRFADFLVRYVVRRRRAFRGSSVVPSFE